MRPLPVYIRPDLRFSCHSCSDCCRSYVVTVDAEEERRLHAQRWWRRGLRFVRGVVTDGLDQWGAPARVLRRCADGRCLLLDADGLCRIHTEHGYAAKPRVCRQFPFVFAHAPDGVRVAATCECTSRHRSIADGRLLTGSRTEIEELAHAATPYRSRFRVRISEPGPLLSTEAYLNLERRARDAMASGPMRIRLVALARIIPPARGASSSAHARERRPTVDELLGAMLPVVREECEDPGRAPLAAAARALSDPGAWRRAVVRCDGLEPASAFLRAVVSGWLDEAVLARAATAADGIGRMLLGAVLCAAPALGHEGQSAAADLHRDGAGRGTESTLAAMNAVARVVSMAFRGERGAELRDRLGRTARLQQAFARLGSGEPVDETA